MSGEEFACSLFIVVATVRTLDQQVDRPEERQRSLLRIEAVAVLLDRHHAPQLGEGT